MPKGNHGHYFLILAPIVCTIFMAMLHSLPSTLQCLEMQCLSPHNYIIYVENAMFRVSTYFDKEDAVLGFKEVH